MKITKNQFNNSIFKYKAATRWIEHFAGRFDKIHGTDIQSRWDALERQIRAEIELYEEAVQEYKKLKHLPLLLEDFYLTRAGIGNDISISERDAVGAFIRRVEDLVVLVELGTAQILANVKLYKGEHNNAIKNKKAR